MSKKKSHRTKNSTYMVVIVGVAALFLFSFSTVLSIAYVWGNDTDYSHGYFVLPMAGILLFARMKTIPSHIHFSTVGFLVFLFGQIIRCIGILTGITPIEHFSLVISLSGVVWGLGGWRLFRWASPVIGYLIWMIPLPFFLAVQNAAQLQKLTAYGAAYCLQTMGIPAIAQGNIIETDLDSLDVAYACSGLQMMIAFLAVSSAFALFSNYHWVGKWVLTLSAIPIAIVCNIIRITATGLAFRYYDAEETRMFFHDFGGLALIPIAVLLVILEIVIYEQTFPKVKN